MKKPNLCLLGFLQALGVIVYCGLVAGFFWSCNKFFVAASGFWATALMLALLVFSAAVTGSIVFGYPAYLALKGKIKDALTLLAYTLLYCLGLLILIGVLIFVVR